MKVAKQCKGQIDGEASATRLAGIKTATGSSGLDESQRTSTVCFQP